MIREDLRDDEHVVTEYYVTCETCGEDAPATLTEDAEGHLREYRECARCDDDAVLVGERRARPRTSGIATCYLEAVPC